MKTPKDIADNYFDKYTKLADSSSRIMLISMLILLTNWLFIVETNYWKFKSVKQEYSSKFQAIENRFKILNQITPADPIESKKIEAKKDSLSVEKKELAKEKDTLKDKISEVNDVPSLIKFVFFISDSLEKGGLILNILFFIILLYLLFIRRICLKYLAKALRIYKLEPSLQINQYQDFNLSSPFWLAPLPGNKNKDVDPKELKTILGWTFNHRFWKAILIAGLFVILLIQVRLAYISFVVNGSKFSFIFFSSATLVILTTLVVTYWLLPIKVEDNFNYEASPNPLSRKDFITLSVFSVLLIFFYGLSTKLSKLIYKRSPRYKAKKTKPNFILPNIRNTFTLNSKSGIVYYINNNGKSIFFDSFLTKYEFNQFNQHIEPFSNISSLKTRRQKPRLRLGHSSWHAENFAIGKIKSKDYRAAAEILIYAIKQNIENFSPSYRLHDLLALICIIHSSSVPTDTWQKLIELSNNSKNIQLIKKVKKWNDNKWKEKILGKKEHVTFDGVKI